jgi:hypothetical protein
LPILNCSTENIFIVTLANRPTEKQSEEFTMIAGSFKSFDLHADIFSYCTFGDKYKAFMGLSYKWLSKTFNIVF